MAIDYLHNHPNFADLIRIVAEERSIVPALIEKDYWIMHCLNGLQQLNLSFELKGGTSLSKGFGIINRFSEDIDIRIEPPAELNVKAGRNHSKSAHVESRKLFYDWLASTIKIDGISDVARDHAFDDRQYRRFPPNIDNSSKMVHFRLTLCGIITTFTACCKRPMCYRSLVRRHINRTNRNDFVQPIIQ